MIKNNDKPKQILGTGFRLDFLHHLMEQNKKLNFNYENIDINNELFKKMLNEIDFIDWANKYII